MKPRPSPLDLRSYFVTEIGCSANVRFDPEKPIILETRDLNIETTVSAALVEEGFSTPVWQILLSVRQNVGVEKNAPYNFFIQLQGWFGLAIDGMTEEQSHQLMETTGGSVLYGVAREVLRNVMATGPYLPILLPSISFHPAAPKSIEETPTSLPRTSSKGRKLASKKSRGSGSR